MQHAPRRTMVRTLTRAGAGGYWDQGRRCVALAQATTAGDISLCLYDDHPNFEAEKEDQLRKVGYRVNAASTRRSLVG
ncbi:MAG: hypothetical protein IPF90_10665, partial [Actinomycetales bacterium]|nr:hypothetical protein [Candidatus Phosphoribacter baldrii]